MGDADVVVQYDGNDHDDDDTKTVVVAMMTMMKETQARINILQVRSGTQSDIARGRPAVVPWLKTSQTASRNNNNNNDNNNNNNNNSQPASQPTNQPTTLKHASPASQPRL